MLKGIKGSAEKEKLSGSIPGCCVCPALSAQCGDLCFTRCVRGKKGPGDDLTKNSTLVAEQKKAMGLSGK